MSSKTSFVGVRLGRDLLERIDRLRVALARSTGVDTNRSEVIRAALVRGLEALEALHGRKGKR